MSPCTMTTTTRCCAKYRTFAADSTRCTEDWPSSLGLFLLTISHDPPSQQGSSPVSVSLMNSQLDGSWHRGAGMTALIERRQQAATFTKANRRPAVPGHHVTVGTSHVKPGWLIGACECGEVAESKVDGVVEAWVTWHRFNAISTN